MFFKALVKFSFPLLFLVPGPGFAIEFEDVSSESGMLTPLESWGSAWGDYDGDHYPDLWTSNHRTKPTLYRNNGDGTFTDIVPQVWSANPNTDGHGSAWADIDGDGDMDLLEQTGGANPANPNARNQFYINNNGVLEEQSESYGLDYGAHRGRSVLWFDYNNDGELDVSLTGYTNSTGEFPSSIFKNQSSNFVNVSDQVGFDCPLKSNFSTLADLSGDGMLDLICHSFTFPQKIYDMSTIPFTDITDLLPKTSLVFDSVFADLNGDLKADNLNIRVPNNRSNTAKVNDYEVHSRLINHQGKVRGFNLTTSGDLEIDITSPTLKARTIFIGSEGVHPNVSGGVTRLNMTLSPSNLDHIGLTFPDANSAAGGFYIGYNLASLKWEIRLSGENTLWGTFRSENIVSEPVLTGYQPSEGMQPRLYISDTSGYLDKSDEAGFDEKVHCVSITAGDFDNDMDMDVYMVCEQSPSNLPNRLYENLGDSNSDGVPEFVLVQNPGAAIGTTTGAGKNVAMADYDVDGFLDLYVTNGHAGGSIPNGPDQLFRNKGNGNNWIQFDLVGQQSNIHGIGARIVATTQDGISQLREQAAGTHSYTQNHQRIHFGLGPNATVDLEITWPSGQVDTFKDVDANELYSVTEGEDIVAIDIDNKPPDTGIKCGEPDYDRMTDKAIFIWKDCSATAVDSWHVIATSGGDMSGSKYTGSATSQAEFDNVTAIELEDIDVLDFTVDPMQIQFDMSVWKTAVDGFNFDISNTGSVCFDITDVPADAQILLGADQTDTPSSFCTP